jgi:hypothetical protein
MTVSTVHQKCPKIIRKSHLNCKVVEFHDNFLFIAGVYEIETKNNTEALGE